MREDEGVRCEVCIFFQASKARPSYGYCKRFPPQIDFENGMHVQPLVNRLDWCGEFKEPSK